MFCINCGSKFDDGNLFCPNCGTKVEPIAQPMEAPAPVAAPVETESAPVATPVEAAPAPIATPFEAVAVPVAAVESAPVQATHLDSEPIKAIPLEPAPAPAPAPAPVIDPLNGAQPVYSQPVYTQPAYVAPVMNSTVTGNPELAKSILVLGIVAVATAATVFFSLAGVICGAIGLSKAKKFSEECGQIFGQARVGKYLSLGGLIGGAVISAYFGFSILIGIISAIAENT